MPTFTLKQEHLKLLAAGEIERDDVEFGGIGLDSKRPFGNSYVHGDMARILGYEDEIGEDGEYPEDVIRKMDRLYDELATAMKVIFTSQSCKPGKYVSHEDKKTGLKVWKFKK